MRSSRTTGACFSGSQINLGDAIEEAGRTRGHLCLGERVRTDQRKVALPFAFIEEQQVRNIPKPARAYRAVIVLLQSVYQAQSGIGPEFLQWRISLVCSVLESTHSGRGAPLDFGPGRA